MQQYEGISKSLYGVKEAIQKKKKSTSVWFLCETLKNANESIVPENKVVT